MGIEETFEQRRHVNGITIDDFDSVDLDDALWVRKNGHGHIVDVSIADASFGLSDLS